MKKKHCLYNYNLISKAEKKTFEITDSFKVMQRAAKTCFSYILKNHKLKKLLVICGPGNNGGDGILIANHLFKKKLLVDIYFPLGFPKTKDSKRALNFLISKEIIKENILLNDYDIIIDALFGTGINKKLNNEILLLFNKINSTKAKIISIDIPSGVSINNGQIINSAIKAHTTLSLHRYKPGQWLLPGKEFCGKTEVLDIGLVNLDNECSLKLNYPKKPPIPSLSDNKYTRGSCLIVAGESYIGASKLACLSASQSALRSGSGLCKLLVHKSQMSFFKIHILEEMLLPYEDTHHFKSIFEKQKFNSVVFGCGAENNIKNIEILKFLLQLNISLVLDATIFTMIQGDRNNFVSLLKQRPAETIMTPHAGEFKRIFSVSGDKINDCLIASKETNSIIIYKGNDTIIGTPEGRAMLNTNSSPYLATAGSGDILAGLAGGFLSQGLNAVNSAQLSCYIHSQCGINIGMGLVASDLIREIPRVIKNMN